MLWFEYVKLLGWHVQTNDFEQLFIMLFLVLTLFIVLSFSIELVVLVQRVLMHHFISYLLETFSFKHAIYGTSN